MGYHEQTSRKEYDRWQHFEGIHGIRFSLIHRLVEDEVKEKEYLGSSRIDPLLSPEEEVEIGKRPPDVIPEP